MIHFTFATSILPFLHDLVTHLTSVIATVSCYSANKISKCFSTKILVVGVTTGCQFFQCGTKMECFRFSGSETRTNTVYRITGKHKYQSLRTMAPTFVSNSQAVAIETHFQYFSIYLPRFTPSSPLVVRSTKVNSLIRQVGEQIFSHVRFNLKFLPASETKMKPRILLAFS